MSKEMIVRLNEDRVKIKGCEYVQDLIRCGECKHWRNVVPTRCKKKYGILCNAEDFCSFAEPNVIERNDG